MHKLVRHRALARAAALGLLLVVNGACGKKAKETTSETSPGTIAPAVGAVRVVDVDVGRGVGADKQITDKTDNFKPTETIYASVHTTGTAQNTTVLTRWMYEDGQLVSERSESISPTGDAYTEFHVSKPTGLPEGKYTIHVLVNGQEVQTKDFKVEK
jgi:hypothetical protein